MRSRFPEVLWRPANQSFNPLRMSVWKESLLFVIVWIHGGAYIMGSHGRSMYGPRFIVRHDVILVTVNYRYAYGFMYLHTPEVPGNQGLKDQLAGLRWVKDNIKAFGGDVDKITLIGESAGSWSTHWHLLSPQEELFYQAVFESGSVSKTDAVATPDTSSAFKLAQALGHVTNDLNEALRFLSRADPNDVMRVVTENHYTFNACVEMDFVGIEKLVTRHPLNSNVPKAKDKKFLIGFNSDETIPMFEPMTLPVLGAFRDTEIHNWLKNHFDFKEEELNRLVRLFKNFYTGNAEPSEQLRFQLADFMSDTLFVYPIERTLTSLLRNGAGNIYYYKFSYVGKRNYQKIISNGTIGGAAHADELGYLFDMDILTETPTAEDQLIIDRMTTLWTNFAKFGYIFP